VRQEAEAGIDGCQGRIIERGAHDERIAQKGPYYQFYTGAFEWEYRIEILFRCVLLLFTIPFLFNYPAS